MFKDSREKDGIPFKGKGAARQHMGRRLRKHSKRGR